MLSEKTDLENTEAFNKESVKDLRKLSTKDINGKDFTSKDFEKYDLTMVNVFATWCTACVKEIPDLVEVQNEMKSKGVNIVGVVTDTVDDTGENKEANNDLFYYVRWDGCSFINLDSMVKRKNL